MLSRIVLRALCLCIILSVTACSRGPESIIIETPVASATPYVTPAPTANPTHAPPRPTRPPAPATPLPPSSQRRLNINTASAEELARLPHIGPVLARRIVDYRQQHGPFTTLAALKDVSGIGDATLAAIQDLIALQ
jgi:competence protein ComEA